MADQIPEGENIQVGKELGLAGTDAFQDGNRIT
jgi:hypothetical protein